MIEPIEYCYVKNCNNFAEDAHLITRANLPKAQRKNKLLIIQLCHFHHSEQHSFGIETFCYKYNLITQLEKARRFIAEYNNKYQ